MSAFGRRTSTSVASGASAGCPRASGSWAGRFVAGDAGVLREAAAAGLGLAVLPSSMIARDLAAARLVALDGFPGRELGVYAVHPHRRHVPPKVRAFVDLLAARFARPPWRADHRAPSPPGGP